MGRVEVLRDESEGMRHSCPVLLCVAEKTVKTWEWMPRRAEATLGLRLLALFIAGHFATSVLIWLYYFGDAVAQNTIRKDGLLGVIDGVAKATWRMVRADDLYRSGGVFVLCTVAFAAWCGYVALSERGVPCWILRRCPRD